MEPITQKLIHSFGALADLGQEVADTGDFIEMVRTSLHLLLGTLAIRRGAVVECPRTQEVTNLLAAWGMADDYEVRFLVDESDREAFLKSADSAISIDSKDELLANFLQRHAAELGAQEIELIVPMIVRGNLTGLVLLGGKASGDPFTAEDIDVIRAMVRHIGVGIHQHRLLAEVK
ncbi:MAG: GAF domain-containing protein, partial [Acidobacteriota bacterium]|nr:GAF domain-containing protein [Acidobacteriota bacterium]